MGALVVELGVVADPAVLEEGLPVVAGDDHHRALPEPVLLQRLPDGADHVVRERDVAVVEAHHVVALGRAQGPPSLVHLLDPVLLRERVLAQRSGKGGGGAEPRVEGRRGVVGLMRLAEVDIGEEAPAAARRQPGRHHAAEDVAPAAVLLPGLVELREAPVEPVEAARHQVGHEARGVDALRAQQLGLGSGAAKETAWWWRSGYCDVQTEAMAPRVYTAGVNTRSKTTPSRARRSTLGLVARA